MIIKNQYTQRLFDEWKQHGNILIGLDVDDTILPYRENFTDCNKVINLVQECIRSNARIIIYTGSAKERYDEIIDYCKSVGIEVSAINENLITPFGDNRKIYANIYLDDRAGLTESLWILESALYQYRGYLKSYKQLDEIG